jgi:hypothetical protein
VLSLIVAQPLEEVVVALDHAALQRDVAELAQAGHLDRRVFGEGAVAVFDDLVFLGQARDFREAGAGATPLDGEVEVGQRDIDAGMMEFPSR